MDLDQVWNRLAHASTFRLAVQPPQGPSHAGTGTISAQLLDPSTIVWTEQGRWTDGPLAGIHFSNATRWERLGNDALRVSHQRRGPLPVLLSTLRRHPDGRWQGDVHLCGEDRYVPTLQLSGAGLLLVWEVASPTDPYRWELSC